jgi:RNA polymerase sigma-70 factor (ECF subfamily)
MAEAPATRSSLLVRLRDPRDADAWRQFVALYAPLVYRFGRRQGLQDADAADLTQEVLRAVSAGAGRFDYDPQRGSFRSWLYTVARRRLADLLARRRRPGLGSGDSATQALLEEQPAPDGAAWWQCEYEQQVFAWAAAQVQPTVSATTWQAFWRTAVEGQDPRAVAGVLGMSVGAVYIAKSRVQSRLREQVLLVTGDDAPGKLSEP